MKGPKYSRIKIMIENVKIYENMYEEKNWMKPVIKDDKNWREIKDAYLLVNPPLFSIEIRLLLFSNTTFSVIALFKLHSPSPLATMTHSNTYNPSMRKFLKISFTRIKLLEIVCAILILIYSPSLTRNRQKEISLLF